MVSTMGLIVDPWAAEGYHTVSGVSGAGESGCKAPPPRITTTGVNIRADAINPVQPDISTGRYPDGKDNDSNCRDFKVQNNIILLAASTAGSDNIKVASVAGFSNGQKLIIDKGVNSETAVIGIVGTAGATTVGTATKRGATVIPVAGLTGFNVGQTITIDNGANGETAVVASITAAPRGGGGVGFGGPGGAAGAPGGAAAGARGAQGPPG